MAPQPPSGVMGSDPGDEPPFVVILVIVLLLALLAAGLRL